MFCVLYRFEIRKGLAADFERHWETVTRRLRDAGSLGSRLHRESDTTYIAYAQWPDRESWEQERNLDDASERARRGMANCCASIETMARLEPVVDLLVHES